MPYCDASLGAFGSVKQSRNCTHILKNAFLGHLQCVFPLLLEFGFFHLGPPLGYFRRMQRCSFAARKGSKILYMRIVLDKINKMRIPGRHLVTTLVVCCLAASPWTFCRCARSSGRDQSLRYSGSSFSPLLDTHYKSTVCFDLWRDRAYSHGQRESDCVIFTGTSKMTAAVLSLRPKKALVRSITPTNAR